MEVQPTSIVACGLCIGKKHKNCERRDVQTGQKRGFYGIPTSNSFHKDH